MPRLFQHQDEKKSPEKAKTNSKKFFFPEIILDFIMIILEIKSQKKEKLANVVISISTKPLSQFEMQKNI